MNLSKMKYEGWEVDEKLYSAFVAFEEFTATDNGKVVLNHLMKVSLVGRELGLPDATGEAVSAETIMNRQRWLREIEKVLNSKPVEPEEGEEYE